MEEALVPAFRMIVNYVVNGLLGPRTAPWKAKHEARAGEIAAHLGVWIPGDKHKATPRAVANNTRDAGG